MKKTGCLLLVLAAIVFIEVSALASECRSTFICERFGIEICNNYNWSIEESFPMINIKVDGLSKTTTIHMAIENKGRTLRQLVDFSIQGIERMGYDLVSEEELLVDQFSAVLCSFVDSTANAKRTLLIFKKDHYVYRIFNNEKANSNGPKAFFRKLSKSIHFLKLDDPFEAESNQQQLTVLKSKIQSMFINKDSALFELTLVTNKEQKLDIIDKIQDAYTRSFYLESTESYDYRTTFIEAFVNSITKGEQIGIVWDEIEPESFEVFWDMSVLPFQQAELLFYFNFKGHRYVSYPFLIYIVRDRIVISSIPISKDPFEKLD